MNCWIIFFYFKLVNVFLLQHSMPQKQGKPKSSTKADQAECEEKGETRKFVKSLQSCYSSYIWRYPKRKQWGGKQVPLSLNPIGHGFF